MEGLEPPRYNDKGLASSIRKHAEAALKCWNKYADKGKLEGPLSTVSHATTQQHLVIVGGDERDDGSSDLRPLAKRLGFKLQTLDLTAYTKEEVQEWRDKGKPYSHDGVFGPGEVVAESTRLVCDMKASGTNDNVEVQVTRMDGVGEALQVVAHVISTEGVKPNVARAQKYRQSAPSVGLDENRLPYLPPHVTSIPLPAWSVVLVTPEPDENDVVMAKEDEPGAYLVGMTTADEADHQTFKHPITEEIMRARATWFGNKNGSSGQYQRTEAVRRMYEQGYGSERVEIVEVEPSEEAPSGVVVQRPSALASLGDKLAILVDDYMLAAIKRRLKERRDALRGLMTSLGMGCKEEKQEEGLIVPFEGAEINVILDTLGIPYKKIRPWLRLLLLVYRDIWDYEQVKEGPFIKALSRLNWGARLISNGTAHLRPMYKVVYAIIPGENSDGTCEDEVTMKVKYVRGDPLYDPSRRDSKPKRYGNRRLVFDKLPKGGRVWDVNNIFCIKREDDATKSLAWYIQNVIYRNGVRAHMYTQIVGQAAVHSVHKAAYALPDSHAEIDESHKADSLGRSMTSDGRVVGTTDASGLGLSTDIDPPMGSGWQGRELFILKFPSPMWHLPIFMFEYYTRRHHTEVHFCSTMVPDTEWQLGVYSLIALRNDNMVNVYGDENGSSHNELLNTEIVETQEAEFRRGRDSATWYIPSKENDRADGGSRGTIKARTDDYHLCDEAWERVSGLTRGRGYTVEACADPTGDNARCARYYHMFNSCSNMVVTSEDDVFINFPFGIFMKLLGEFEDTVRRSPAFRWTMVVPVGAPKRENRRFMENAVRRIQALGAVRRFTFEKDEFVFVPRQTVYWWPQRVRAFGEVLPLRWPVEIWRRDWDD